jgi:hypothetical protein
MVFRSLLPPIPDLSLPNAHHLFLNRPDQAEWEDYILHVDALTGKTRRWSEFKDRVKRGATVLGNPSLFPHGRGEIVGILSENCIVSCSGSVFEPYTDGKALYVGVRGAYSFAIGRGHSVRSIPGITDPIRVEASRQSLQDQEDLYEPAEF